MVLSLMEDKLGYLSDYVKAVDSAYYYQYESVFGEMTMPRN